MVTRFRGERASLARRWVAAGSLAAASLACGAATALAAPRPADPLTAGPLAAAPGAGPVRDRVIHSPRPLAAAAGATGGTYPDADGHRVRVEVSDAYTNPGAAAQDLVDFLGSLLHGDELGELRAKIATPAEIRRVCGTGALACYFPGLEQIVVSGEDAEPGDPPRELVIAHEYGHHLAHNRTNRPWSALARGTKRWSTYEHVCDGIKSGRIEPGRYWQNPGEAFAEAYAFYHFPNAIGWEWQIARPDQGAFDAIFADVTEPWLRRTSSEWSGDLGPGAHRDVTRVATPLDGALTLSLNGPSQADFDLRVLARRSGRVLARAAGRHADERLRYEVCGRRSVKVAVKRESGSGEFELRALTP